MVDIITSSVYGVDDTIDGYSQADLGDIWWQTFMAIPADQNPLLLDDNSSGGETDSSNKASLSRFDSIQLLGGLLSAQGPVGRAERSIVVPGGTVFFLPILNTVGPEVIVKDGIILEGIGPNGLTGEEVRQGLSDLVGNRDLVEELNASIDGVTIPNLFNYRQQSEQPFIYYLPQDNALEINGIAPPGDYLGGALSDGYWLGIGQLSPESHVISFGAALEYDDAQLGPDFVLDVTYNISFDLNEINGDRHDNRCSVRGTDGWDEINGKGGNDYIVGRGGNDALHGDRGNDTLIGVDPNRHHAGRGEIDILWGGQGRDTFVLGDRHHAFYLGQGLADYAIIKDFVKGEDVIRLSGCRGSYQLREDYTLSGRTGTAIMRGSCELVAFVDRVSNLSLQSGNFAVWH